MKKFLPIVLAVVLLLSLPVAVLAAWATSPTVNNAISTVAGNQLRPQLVSDGSGGAIITWQDARSGDDFYDIYAQRVNATGVAQWTANGVAIATAANDQNSPQLVSDGAGGAISTWQDNRSGNNDIYAQRVNASGAVQWTANGLAIATTGSNQNSPQLVADGAGGAIITWEDNEDEGFYNIYAQRVNAAGAVQWTANGLAITIATNDQDTPRIIADGSGGAIITWQDSRSGNTDIYAQRVDSAGNVQWTVNGVAIVTAAAQQAAPQLVSDGAGGAIITWQDSRSGSNTDIYAQRVNTSGAVQWTANGLAIATAAFDQEDPQLVADGAGGAIITWEDGRDGSGEYDIYAQRVNASGAVQWTANGLAIATAVSDLLRPQLVADGAAGAIITWQDSRSGTGFDIYAQRVNAAGTAQWTANGLAIATAANEQENPQIIADGAAGAIITWEDGRSGTNNDIYAQRVLGTGILGDPPPDILVGVEVYPLNKLALLAPWLTLAAIVVLAVGSGLFALRRRRAH